MNKAAGSSVAWLVPAPLRFSLSLLYGGMDPDFHVKSCVQMVGTNFFYYIAGHIWPTGYKFVASVLQRGSFQLHNNYDDLIL